MKEEKKYLELESYPRAKIVDLTGETFSNLTVIKFDIDRYTNNRNKHYWICECSCGNKVVTDKYNLIHGYATMCKSCASIEFGKVQRERNKKLYSFGQWCLDKNHQDYLDLWDYELNKDNPFEITYSNNRKYYFKCSRGLHDSKLISISKIVNGRRVFCNKCNSVGQYMLDTYGNMELWSEKNSVDPFSISRGSDTRKVWLKCENGIHEDYMIRPDAMTYRIGCVKCTREKKESQLQNKVNTYIKSLGYDVVTEYDCNIIPRNPKTNRGFPFDNEVIELKLLVEVHGKQHYEECNWHKTASKRNGTTEEYEFHKRRLYDRYKHYVAYKNGYHYLEIPYWTEGDEGYKKLINDKIDGIIKLKKGGGC